MSLILLSAAAAADDGSVARGKDAYEARCGGCHSVAADRIGPRHEGLIGRRAGSVAGFAYSDALRNSELIWNAQNLQQWLKDPESVIPGQRMVYRLNDEQMRADIAAYLSGLNTAKPQGH